ncbi:trypsin-like peptidase domain-containing protein [Streptomyces dangxiongensis]|uniref:trypsin-like peptidase domain-containing protein n=1 Tax=Streptomyces dangxiongensis TaxID=1442032 RepID=UPI001F090668|nr:trypsin-like peptidase domain-containing protein [Streptomyces dangxiongensis]
MTERGPRTAGGRRDHGDEPARGAQAAQAASSDERGGEERDAAGGRGAAGSGRGRCEADVDGTGGDGAGAIAGDGAGRADAALVRVHDPAGRPHGLGFLVDHEGTLLTSHECVDGLSRLVLHAADRTCVVTSDAVTPLPALDLALVHTEGLGVDPLPLTVRERIDAGTYVRIVAGCWREARVLAATPVTYTATDGVHLLDDALELAIGTAGRDALRLGGGAAGGPVLDARTGAVVGVLGTALHTDRRDAGFAVPLRPAADAALAGLLERNAATVPAYGADLNLAGILQVTETSVGQDGPPGALTGHMDAVEPVERADVVRELAAFTGADRPVLGLVGAPGSGRTTELAALAARRARGDLAAPTVWSRGGDLAEGDGSSAGAALRTGGAPAAPTLRSHGGDRSASDGAGVEVAGGAGGGLYAPMLWLRGGDRSESDGSGAGAAERMGRRLPAPTLRSHGADRSEGDGSVADRAGRAGGGLSAPTVWLRGADLIEGDSSVADAAARTVERAARIVAASLGVQPEDLGDLTPERLARLAARAGRPLLLLLDGPEEMPPVLAHRLPEWTRGTTDWLRATGARLVVACREEYWERAGTYFPADLLHTPATHAPPRPATDAPPPAPAVRVVSPSAVPMVDAPLPAPVSQAVAPPAVPTADARPSAPAAHAVPPAACPDRALLAAPVLTPSTPAAPLPAPGDHAVSPPNAPTPGARPSASALVHTAPAPATAPASSGPITPEVLLLAEAPSEAPPPASPTPTPPDASSQPFASPEASPHTPARPEASPPASATSSTSPLTPATSPAPPSPLAGPVPGTAPLPLPPCLRLGDLDVGEARRARVRYGVAEGVLAERDAAHPLALRLVSEVGAAVPDAQVAGPVERHDVFTAYLDVICLRVAVRLAAAAGLRGTAVRRLAARVAGQVHEAARRSLGPGQGELDREAFETVFPWGPAPARLGGGTGWASAVLTEGLLVPAGRGYRFAHEELADWIQGVHLDLDEALRALVHRPGGRREPHPVPVPHHRAGPVVQALLHLARQHGPQELASRLGELIDALERDPGSWWAARLLARTLLGVPDATPYTETLRLLADRVVAWRRAERPVPAEFGPAFWTAVPVSGTERLDLLRRLVLADPAPPAAGDRYLDAVAGLLAAAPTVVQPLLTHWFTDERPLPATPHATVATAAQALLHTHRHGALDDLTEVLVNRADPRADELLAVLAEDEPSAVCRAVDRWVHDERPARRAAAVTSGLRAAPHVGSDADRELLRWAALALLARPADRALHGGALALLVRDPHTRDRHLPAALRHFADGDPLLPPSALVPALATHPEPVLDAFRTRLHAPDADGPQTAAVLRGLGEVTTPALARRVAVLVGEAVRLCPGTAGHVAGHVDRRLEQGPTARSVLLPLVTGLLEGGPEQVRAALATVLAAAGTPASRPLRRELLEFLLTREQDRGSAEVSPRAASS